MLEDLKNNKFDLYRIASYAYKIGSPIISDDDFNQLEIELKEEESNNKLFSLVSEDFSEPAELLAKYQIKFDQNTLPESWEPVGVNANYQLYLDILQDKGTKSIEPLFNYEDVYCRFMQLKQAGLEIILSLKVDGVSTRSIVELNDANEWKFVASLSRGRDGKGFDYSKGMIGKFPVNSEYNADVGELNDITEKQTIFVYGEAYVCKSALEFLRNKYGNNDTWKTPRSTALSMLRCKISEEDYKYLKLKVFKTSATTKNHTLSQMLEDAKTAGYDIVPYEVINATVIPRDFNQFKLWIDNYLARYTAISEKMDIESDGLVIEVNNFQSCLFKLHKTTIYIFKHLG